MKIDFALYIVTLLEFTDSFKLSPYLCHLFSATNISSLAVLFCCTVTLHNLYPAEADHKLFTFSCLFCQQNSTEKQMFYLLRKLEQ